MKLVSTYLKGNLTDYEYDRTDYRVKYDLDNRIIEVKADSETIRYRYDALGRRIVSKGDDEIILIWWGDSECAEYEHRASQDAIQNDIMGHPTRLNSVIARDTEDRENRVELQWYHKNYLDHVYAVSDDNGNLIEHYRYTAFGEPEIYSATGARRNTSAIGNTVMWNTRRYDADNGLYYYKYRHYAANIGRWLGRDPIEENGGVNLYAFVGNQVLTEWDVFGLSPVVISRRPGKVTLHCVRCKENPNGPMSCILISSLTGLLGNPFLTNEGSNHPSTTPGDPYGTKGPLPPGKYDVVPKPYGDGNNNFGKRKPGYRKGTPSITQPGKPPGTIITPKGTRRSVLRIHGRGESHGCITCNQGYNGPRRYPDGTSVKDPHTGLDPRSDIEDAMNNYEGGMELIVMELCCEDGKVAPRAIPVNP